MLFGVCSRIKIVTFGVRLSNFGGVTPNEVKYLGYKHVVCDDNYSIFQTKSLFLVYSTMKSRGQTWGRRERERVRLADRQTERARGK
jgi:hypothetical protein